MSPKILVLRNPLKIIPFGQITFQISNLTKNMIRKLLIALCLIGLSSAIASAQKIQVGDVIAITNTQDISNLRAKWLQEFTNMSRASNYESVTNWGETNYGCQLSIGLDTNVIKAGSSVVFHWWIKNSSAGNVELVKSSWSLILTNDSGAVYPVNLPAAIDAPFLSRNDANSGEFIVKKERVIFSHNIGAGDYVIKPFTRDIITADGKTCRLTSNPLKIKIIATSPPDIKESVLIDKN